MIQFFALTSSSIPTSGLNFYFDAIWQSNRANQMTSYDRSGNYQQMITFLNGPIVDMSDANGSISLDGTNDLIPTPITVTESASASVVLWMKRTQSPVAYAGIFYCRTASGGHVSGLHFGNTTGAHNQKLRYTWNNANFDVETHLTQSLNQWSYVSLSVNATGATFINATQTWGSRRSFRHVTTNNKVSFHIPWIGWDGFSNRYAPIKVGMLLFYHRNISDRESQTIWELTKGRFYGSN
jgi:hypothetical protein